MADLIQVNRIYELKVGDTSTGNGLLINNLQVTFDISKTSSNKDKTNGATIEVYNLSDESLKLIDVDYPYASFSAGYRDIGMKELFSGQVTNVTTRKNGTDRISQIMIGSAYTKLNHELISRTLPPGSSVKQAYEELAKEIGITRTVFNTVNLDSNIIRGYPLSGTKRQMLDELSKKYGMNWQIDGDTLYVHDADRGNSEKFEQAYVISKYTGLIENAYRESGDIRRSKKDKVKKQSVVFKCLLNPDLVAGSIVKLEDTLIQGFYKIDELRHTGDWRGSSWYTECRCSAIEKVVVNK